MMQNHHNIKNRQQAMLNRSAEEVGLDPADYWTTIQGKPQPSFRNSYKRSSAAMS
jgi:hypothetical protein